jgi:hypothetical protein
MGRRWWGLAMGKSLPKPTYMRILMVVHGHPADGLTRAQIQRVFSGSVRAMVPTLERRGLLARWPGSSRQNRAWFLTDKGADMVADANRRMSRSRGAA